jgi:hypothetical protein
MIEHKKRKSAKSMKLLSITLLFLLSALACNRIAIKPLTSPSLAEYDCSVPESKIGTSSFIEDSLRRHDAKSAKPFRIAADFGSNNKFVKLFKTNDSDTMKQIVVLFHFIDRYDYDQIKGNVVFKLDNDSFEKPVFIDPASVIISEMSDQFYFVYLTNPELCKLAFCNTVTGRIGPVDFALPYLCRKNWRSFCER